MIERGWTDIGESNDYDFAWLTKEEVQATYDQRRSQAVKSWVNHFANHQQLSRKDLLAQNVQKQLRALQKINHPQAESFRTIPTTFILPENYAAFQRYASERSTSEMNHPLSPQRVKISNISHSTAKSRKELRTIPPKPIPQESKIPRIDDLQKLKQPLGKISRNSSRDDFSKQDDSFALEVKDQSQKFIVKPACLLQGQGIFIATAEEIRAWYQTTYPQIVRQAAQFDQKAAEAIFAQYKRRGINISREAIGSQFKSGHDLYLIQKYIENPLLINGHKFDCRVYVLVRSFKPLQVWVCNEGFARFALTQYSADFSQQAAHLTNVAIQKTADNYDPQGEGAKWSMFQLFQRIKLQFGPRKSRLCQENMETTILRVLQSVYLLEPVDQKAFEVYGFDVMLTDQLEAQVCEVNACPSLTADTQDDLLVKKRMLHDALSLTVGGVDKEVFGCFHAIFNGQVDQEDFDKGRVRTGVLLGDRVERGGLMM